MNNLKVNDVIYFTNKRVSDTKRSFIGYDVNGKIIVSDRMLDRGGFFKISNINEENDYHYTVTLGERVYPDDVYPEISIDELKPVLKEFDFEFYEKPLKFKAYGDDRNEVQILAWHKKYNIFINGTTWRCDGYNQFNNLNIYAPNYYHIWHKYSKGQIGTSSKEININVVKSDGEESILTHLLHIAENSSNEKICMVLVNKNGDSSLMNLYSYASEFIYNSDLLFYSDKYCNDLYNELPENAKDFICRNSKSI